MPSGRYFCVIMHDLLVSKANFVIERFIGLLNLHFIRKFLLLFFFFKIFYRVKFLLLLTKYFHQKILNISIMLISRNSKKVCKNKNIKKIIKNKQIKKKKSKTKIFLKISPAKIKQDCFNFLRPLIYFLKFLVLN